MAKTYRYIYLAMVILLGVGLIGETQGSMQEKEVSTRNSVTWKVSTKGDSRGSASNHYFVHFCLAIDGMPADGATLKGMWLDVAFAEPTSAGFSVDWDWSGFGQNIVQFAAVDQPVLTRTVQMQVGDTFTNGWGNVLENVGNLVQGS